jgi:multiple sugar transport system substrate-binding protein/sn-glycerol 3-phosphate transport system substrate-binding protein
MKKFTLFVVVVLALLLAAVPGFAQDYEGVSPEGATVEFWHQHTSFRAVQLNAIIAVFNNPDVVVADFIAEQVAAGNEISESRAAVLETIIEGLREVAREYNPYGIVVNPSNQGGYGDIFDKMTLGIVAGGQDLPELVVAYQNQAATYQIDDALIDITPLIDSPTWGLSAEDLGDFFPSFIASDTFSIYDGARLGFPPNRSMEVMYYNVDWLAELSANGAISFEGAPQTPDQFREAACAAVANPFSGAANTDSASIGYQLSIDASRFASWTFAFGGDIFDYENNAYTLDSEAAVAAMEFLQGLFADGCAVEVTENFGDQTSFGQGLTLFTVGSSSGLPFYQSAIDGAYEGIEDGGFSWSVGPVPYVTETPRQNIYGASVSIPKSTPEQELATWIFVKYYSSPEVQAYWAVAANYFPVRASVAEGLAGYFETNPAYQVAFDLLQYGMAEPPVPGYDPVRNAMGETMAFLAQNPDESAVDALTELNEEANAELQELLADIEG